MTYKTAVKKKIGKKTFKRLNSPQRLPKSLSIKGTKYVGHYHFLCANDVPIFEVDTVHSFNQLIGHAKFNNHAYGNVYYRGECKLHDSLKPSLFRNGKNVEKATEKLSRLIQKFVDDPYMKIELKINERDYNRTKYKIEGMLQHYGIPTRFIDVVDNHWIALWMGLNQTEKSKQLNRYYHYSERSLPLIELAKEKSSLDNDLFQYVLLIAVPFSKQRILTGIQVSNDYVEVDLRQALPSTFLRPHAQHGFVIRRKVHNDDYRKGADAYDMASSVIGIIKVRIDKVQKWIGTGELLTQNNLFPPPAYDYGYDLLLTRSDLFDGSEFAVSRYV